MQSQLCDSQESYSDLKKNTDDHMKTITALREEVKDAQKEAEEYKRKQYNTSPKVAQENVAMESNIEQDKLSHDRNRELNNEFSLLGAFADDPNKENAPDISNVSKMPGDGTPLIYKSPRSNSRSSLSDDEFQLDRGPRTPCDGISAVTSLSKTPSSEEVDDLKCKVDRLTVVMTKILEENPNISCEPDELPLSPYDNDQKAPFSREKLLARRSMNSFKLPKLTCSLAPYISMLMNADVSSSKGHGAGIH